MESWNAYFSFGVETQITLRVEITAIFKKSRIVVYIIWQTKISFNPKIACYSGTLQHISNFEAF
jgi:hypothetical protein